jgi:broad specificity phosphatase PhoE
MTVIHLARHGETVWHHGNRYAGRSDVALTERGARQADELAAWAATASIERLVSSDLSRAVRTAAAVARTTGLAHELEPRLREVDFGRGEGLTEAEMTEAFPAERAAFVATPASSPLPGGERGADAVARALPAVRDLAATSSGPVLIVAHTTLIRLLLCELLGLPLDDYRRRFPSLANVAITTLRLDGDAAPALLRFNLPPR